MSSMLRSLSSNTASAKQLVRLKGSGTLVGTTNGNIPVFREKIFCTIGEQIVYGLHTKMHAKILPHSVKMQEVREIIG